MVMSVDWSNEDYRSLFQWHGRKANDCRWTATTLYQRVGRVIANPETATDAECRELLNEIDPVPGDSNRTGAPRQQVQFPELIAFAQAKTKGTERRVIELVCEKAGSCPLADLANDPGIRWEHPWDNAYNKAQGRINKKLRLNRLPWRLYRRDNSAKLKRLENRSERA
jgi:hypothetical protein